MDEHELKWGYCANCLENVPHYREFRFPPLRLLDSLTPQTLRFLRIGPWYCEQCDRKTALLKRADPDVTYFDPPVADAHPTPLISARSDGKHRVNEPVGNFIKTEESLVVRSSRLKRFSEKYRDSVVRKVLSKVTTIAQAREENNISESELVDWISDMFDRMESRLKVTDEKLEKYPSLNHLRSQPESVDEYSAPDTPTIEGKAKPR